MNSPAIKLVLADPHPVMLDGLCAHIKNCHDLQVQACAQDGENAWRSVQLHRPDFLVMDLNLYARDGFELIEALRSEGGSTRPIVFTSAPVQDVMRAVDLGVRGLVSKHRPHESLVECVRQVHQGHTCLDQDLMVRSVSVLLDRERSRSDVSRLLTPREVDVARMVTEGWPNKKIASKLSISEGTAKLHLHHIYQKLNCPGRMALLIYMQRHGLA